MVQVAEQCTKLPTTNSHAIYINFLAYGSVQLCTFSPVQSFQNTLTAEVINSQDMVGLLSQTSHEFMLWKIFNIPDFDRLYSLQKVALHVIPIFSLTLYA